MKAHMFWGVAAMFCMVAAVVTGMSMGGDKKGE